MELQQSAFIRAGGIGNMTHPFFLRTEIRVAGLVLLILFITGCESLQPRWTVRTTSTLFSSPSDLASLEQEAVALFTPLAPAPLLRGDEAGLGLYLAESIKKVAPAWKIIDEQQTIGLINRHGLREEYTRLRQGADQSHILDRELLQKIGKSIGARYVLQPRVAYISQTMTNRLEAPVAPFLILQTRSAVMRLSLQLWDTVSGEPIWSSAAESAVLNETASLDPMFIKDAARAAFGSMLTDLLTRKTSSKYTRLDQFMDNLTHEKNE
jgi:hypothetical protein